MNIISLRRPLHRGPMHHRPIVLVPILLVALAGGFYATQAQTLRDVRLDQPIQPGSSTTFRTLLQPVVPNLTADGKAGHTGYVRDGWLVNDASVYQGQFDLVKLDAARVKTPAGPRLVLFLKLESEGNPALPWGELALLAIFRTAPEPKLLDVVDVGADRTTTFYGTLPFRTNADAVIVEYEYRNAQDREYRHFSILQISDEDLGPLFGEFPYLLYGQSGKTELTEAGEFSSPPNGRSSYRAMIFTINTAVNTYASDGLTIVRTRSRTFRLRAVWQRGRYRYADRGAAMRRLIATRRHAGFD
jgi:hypothetical protein